MNPFNVGPLELLILGIVALVVVGPRQLPELGRMLGKWMKTVRDAADELRRGLYFEDDHQRYRPSSQQISRTYPVPAPTTEPIKTETNQTVESSDSNTENDSQDQHDRTEKIEESEKNEGEYPD